MESIYWIGIKESDLDDVNNVYNKSVTFFGQETINNTSFSAKSKTRINHNLYHENASKFIANAIQEIITNDKDAKLMYFGPYHAYYLPEVLQEAVYCRNEKNILELLRNKINTRFWLSQTIPTVPSVLLNTSNCNYNTINALFKDISTKFVVQRNYSAGGYSTFLLTKEKNIIFEKDELLLVSPYIEKSIPINITAIIYEDDIVLFPASIQIIVEDNNRLLYKGADFITYKEVDELLKHKVLDYTYKVAENLKNIGYRGVCGIDYITDGQEVYFMEVNERFQASTYLLNIALKKEGFPSVQELCLESFQKPTCSVVLDELDVHFSNYIYTYHKQYQHCYSYIYQKAKENHNVYRIAEDGFQDCTSFEEDAYLFALVFESNIVSLNYDGNINIDEHVTEHKMLTEKDVLETKFHLLNQGFCMTESALNYMQENGNARAAIHQGIDLILFNGIRVSSVWVNTRLLYLSPFEVIYDPTKGLVLTHYGNYISKVAYDLPDALSNYYTVNGIPYSNIAFLANNRLQINHECICYYKKAHQSCKFCSLPELERTFSLEDVYEVVDAYLEKKDFSNFLIGGASQIYPNGWERILDIAGYISRKSDKPIYLMSPPPDNKEILYKLKESGVTQVAFNIEVFDRTVAKDIMPGKGKIPLEVYLSILKESTFIWGKTGNVRSMLIVGLESCDSLMNGIETLAKDGIQPILSPFGPHKDTVLKNLIPLNSEKLIEVFMKAYHICQQYQLKPGPDNKDCQNNTLSIPDEYIPR